MHSRIARLEGRFREHGIDAMLVTSGPNVRYLSGFSGSWGALLVGDGGAALFTDTRYAIQVGEEAPGAELRIVSGSPGAEALRERGRGRRIGFEDERITVAEHRRLSAAMEGGSLVPLAGLVEDLREIKEPGEIDAILESGRVTSGAFHSGLAVLREGRTEAAVAAWIEGSMRQAGASGPAFESIVGSGPRGALPHGRATAKALRRGEPVVVDIGAMVGGYASDMTRTVFVGEATPRGREAHAAVLAAVTQTEAAVRDGVEAGEVDRVARKALEDAGFGDHAYGHGTGHGVGLEVHERPRVARGRQERLREGMVLTIEPGVYIPGWGGVRIEDMVLVEKEGCRLLTSTPKDLLAV